MKPYLVLGGVLFVLAFAIGVFVQQPAPPDALPTLALNLQQPCDLRQAACEASNSTGQRVRFRINPNTIPVMQELHVEVATEGVTNIRSARVTVEGVNMFMGYQLVDLQAIAGSLLSGKLILPICTQEKMQWKALLEINTDTTRLLASFPFESAKD